MFPVLYTVNGFLLNAGEYFEIEPFEPSECPPFHGGVLSMVFCLLISRFLLFFVT